MSGWRSVPSLLRHCVVAVYNKSTGGSPDGVVRAFKICRDKLAQQGYLYPRGRNEILESIQLTGKGYVRSLEHSSEGGDGSGKDLTFAKLFQIIEPRLYEYDGIGGRQPPKGQPSMDGTASNEESANIIDDPEVIGNIGGIGLLYPPNKAPKR